jgi:hypothetical protein
MNKILGFPNNSFYGEIEYVVGPTRLIRESDVRKMPYLQAYVKKCQDSIHLHPLPLDSHQFRIAKSTATM